ncbi:MAG: sugar ABC transporter ATP-binding protein [Planctomycetota bacterium]|jgi:ABC-type sugar transport system ATPase subunit
MSLLELAQVTKSFPGVKALDSVDLAVDAGEVHALVGENGAGKSTLMKVLGGAYVADSGTVTLDGAPLPVGDPLAVARRGVQIIYQELTLVPGLTAAENIFLGRELGRPWLKRAAMRAKAQELLDDLGADVDAGTLVGDLSVPNQQMVEIARALHGASKVLVLDEPTSTLPGPDVERLLAIVRRLRDRGLAIVYISHRLEEVFRIADRITVLRDGAHVATEDAAALDRAGLIRLMVGRDLEEEFPARSPRPGQTVLEFEGVDVKEGEIVGLAGLVGSGRTRTGLTLFGALPGGPFRGPPDALAAGVAYITEDRKAAGIFPWLDVKTNITVSTLAEFTRGGWLDRGREREAARAAMRDFDVRASGLRQRAGTLSGGNQQKLLLARFLLAPRKLLILDEPTRGVDVGAKAEIYQLMNRLTEQGLGILMISSEMEELLGMADRVVVMRRGRTVGGLARHEATQERIMELATT